MKNPWCLFDNRKLYYIEYLYLNYGVHRRCDMWIKYKHCVHTYFDVKSEMLYNLNNIAYNFNIKHSSYIHYTRRSSNVYVNYRTIKQFANLLISIVFRKDRTLPLRLKFI